MESGNILLYDFQCGRPFFSRKKDCFFFPDTVDMGRGGVGVRVRVSVYSNVLGLFRNIPSQNTGTTRGPHQIPQLPYFYPR